jgi:PhnB protein
MRTEVLTHVRGVGSRMSDPGNSLISVMLAVPNAPIAAAWYGDALGAQKLWDLGSVVGLTINGAPFFLGEPANNGWDHPAHLGMPSVRIEVFCDDPDAFITRAIAAGARGRTAPASTHAMPWGPHRQGSFVDPFGHLWFVGDRSPLRPHSTGHVDTAKPGA